MSAGGSESHDNASDGNALDLLEREDRELQRIFTTMQQKRGLTVEERVDYGDLAKQSIRHLAVREAALVDITRVLADPSQLGGVAGRLESNMLEGRPHIDRVEKMSRGIQGMNLRIGQDFDDAMLELIDVVSPQIEWELNEGLPELNGSLAHSDRAEQLKSATHLESHAPTNLHPDGPRWWESAPVLSRILTVYDHLRDFPRASKRRL